MIHIFKASAAQVIFQACGMIRPDAFSHSQSILTSSSTSTIRIYQSLLYKDPNVSQSILGRAAFFQIPSMHPVLIMLPITLHFNLCTVSQNADPKVICNAG